MSGNKPHFSKENKKATTKQNNNIKSNNKLSADIKFSKLKLSLTIGDDPYIPEDWK